MVTVIFGDRQRKSTKKGLICFKNYCLKAIKGHFLRKYTNGMQSEVKKSQTQEDF